MPKSPSNGWLQEFIPAPTLDVETMRGIVRSLGRADMAERLIAVGPGHIEMSRPLEPVRYCYAVRITDDPVDDAKVERISMPGLLPLPYNEVWTIRYER